MEVVNIKKAIIVAKKIKKEGKRLVVVGGSFDILHVGHVIYLEKAKKKGEVLMVLLESDERIKRIKGENRPINKQADRAKLLSSLRMVDIVVCLRDMKDNSDYDELLTKIKPSIIAVEGSDKILKIKKRQAKMVGAKLMVVTKRVGEYSSSKVVEVI